MTGGSARRLGAAALAFACLLVVVVGQAGADDAQKFSITGPATVTEGGTATYTISLTDGADDDATVKVDVATGGGTSASDISYTSETLTVPKDGMENFTVQATQDTADEVNEPFTVSISDPVRATLDDSKKSVTTNIVDDDTPAFSISDAAAVEEGGLATFTISVTPAPATPVSVSFQTANGSAAAPGDFTARPATPVPFAAGETSKEVTVQTLDETPALDEDTETFTVTLSAPSANTSIADGSGTGTITDDDPEVTVGTVSDVTVVEGNTGLVDAAITVTLSAASGKTVTVPYATAPASASEGLDYEHKTGNYVFPPGDVSETVIFKVKGDTIFEQPDETFSVVLTDPINGAPGPDMRGEITIDDDDATPAPTLSNPSVNEGNSGLTDLVFQATLGCPRAQVSFNYRTVAGTANASDFTEVGGAQITFPACSAGAPNTTLPITIKVKGDTLDELDETLTLELLNPTTSVVVRTATGTITNDDNNSKLSINDASAGEPGTMTFTVKLEPASAREVKINWATADGTATAGADYTSAGGTLTFAPGETSKSIAVAVLGDSTNEENETLKVNLSNPSGVPANNVVDGQGDGTIVDANAPPSLSISDASAREGTGATFTVTLAGTTLRTVTVGFATVEATAKAGSDFAARTGTLSFAPGESSKTITVTVIDDTAAEPTEDFFVTIGDAVNATITKNRGLGMIEASDQVAQPPTPTNDPPKPVAKPASVLVPRMILGPRTVTIGVNGVARMLVTCQRVSPIGCAGTVELERSTKPLLKLGKKTFTVKKGGKGYVSIKLSARTLAILRKNKNGTLKAKVVVIVKTSTKKTMRVSPGVITLKGTKAFLKAKPKPPPPPATQVVVDP